MNTNREYSERNLIEFIKSKLYHKFDCIWTHKKISSSPIFKNYIKGKLGFIPILQPEFDLVFKTHQGNLNAIEVKYLDSTTRGYNLPYYFGIGQALALQRFGFDHVGLWLFVGENISDVDLNKYGAEAWSFIRNELCLKIEYSFFRIRKTKKGPRFLVMQYSGKQVGYELIDIDSNDFLITWKYPNPIRHEFVAKELRHAIELYLDGRLKNCQH